MTPSRYDNAWRYMTAMCATVALARTVPGPYGWFDTAAVAVLLLVGAVCFVLGLVSLFTAPRRTADRAETIRAVLAENQALRAEAGRDFEARAAALDLTIHGLTVEQIATLSGLVRRYGSVEALVEARRKT